MDAREIRAPSEVKFAMRLNPSSKRNTLTSEYIQLVSGGIRRKSYYNRICSNNRYWSTSLVGKKSGPSLVVLLFIHLQNTALSDEYTSSVLAKTLPAFWAVGRIKGTIKPGLNWICVFPAFASALLVATGFGTCRDRTIDAFINSVLTVAVIIDTVSVAGAHVVMV